MRNKINEKQINDAAGRCLRSGSQIGNTRSAGKTRTAQRIGLAVLMATSVGFSGCQMFRLPGNPFAGAKLPMAKLPIPKLPSLAKLPKPNFSNIARAVRTPSQQVFSSNGSSVASAKNQPPPPPPLRKFDSTATDQQLAKSGTPLNLKSDFDSESAVEKIDKPVVLTDAQKRFKAALSEQMTANSKSEQPSVGGQSNDGGRGLWSDYRPDSSVAAAGNRTANGVQDLAKVNRNLYDQYGKLTVNGESSKLSEPFDPKNFSAKISDEALEKTNRSVAELKQELQRMKTRGAGSSDQFTLPPRSALEIAGSGPLVPAAKTSQSPPQSTTFKGFGSTVELGSVRQGKSSDLANRGTVHVARTNSHVNILRTRPAQIPGLVPTVEIKGSGKYAATQFGRYENSKSNANGETLATNKSESKRVLPETDGSEASGLSGDGNQANQFVKTMSDQSLPVLTATPSEAMEMPLPREISDASIAAIRENQRAAAAAPLPKVTLQNPIQQTPIAMPPQPAGPVQPVVGQVATQPVPAQFSGALGAMFQSPPAQFSRIRNNPFFKPEAKQSQALEVAQPSVARVAQVVQEPSIQTAPRGPALSGRTSANTQTTTDLPSVLATGDGSYAPGSVVRPSNDTLLIR